MRAAILAGGRGTRLRPYTMVLPKPLVPVGERPILELILRQLARDGFSEVDFCVGHLGELIKAYFAESKFKPDAMELRYHWEDEPLGTAGALHLLGEPTGDLLVMNGDILTTLDYGDLMTHHRESRAALTIATYLKDVEISLGIVEGEASEVTDYVEKPTLHYEVSMGIYVYSPRAFLQIPRERFDFPDLVLKLIAAGESVSKYRFDGPWYDIGTPVEHELATAAFEADPGLYDGV